MTAIKRFLKRTRVDIVNEKFRERESFFYLLSPFDTFAS